LQKNITMNNITPYPVLEYVVNVIKNTISDIKTEYTAADAATLKDGNDTIDLVQRFDETGKTATIFIKDPKDIIFSEDLFPELKNLQQSAKGKSIPEIKDATVIINDLNIETHLIFQGVKDFFDELSSSYEFGKTVEKEANITKNTYKFGSHFFGLTVINEKDTIIVKTGFQASTDAAIKKIIENDALKVQNAAIKMFKTGK
jgi:hypothetical protein